MSSVRFGPGMFLPHAKLARTKDVVRWLFPHYQRLAGIHATLARKVIHLVSSFTSEMYFEGCVPEGLNPTCFLFPRYHFVAVGMPPLSHRQPPQCFLLLVYGLCGTSLGV